ncbi:MAG: galactosyltransferase-related protein [Pseudomonadota bacterium]
MILEQDSAVPDPDRMAVLVPFRDRRDDLDPLVVHLGRQLHRERIAYDLLVLEQAGDAAFNKGKLLNAGSTLAPDHGWLCFHDVDMLPLANSHYGRPQGPTRLCYAHSGNGPYSAITDEILGGVFLIPTGDFKRINGFGNEFWGWGFEDNDLSRRCRDAGLIIDFRPMFFRHLEHERQGSPHRAESDAIFRRGNTATDGLNSLSFEMIEEIPAAGYRHVLLDLGRPHGT